MPLTLVQFEYAWEIHAYLRLAGIYYEEENSTYPTSKVGGKLPYLKDHCYVVPEDCAIAYLMKNYTNLDLDFSEAERSEISIDSYLLHSVGQAIYRKRRWGNYSTMKSVLHKLYTPAYGALSAYMYGVENYIASKKHYKVLLTATSMKDDEMLSVLESLYACLNNRFAAQKEPDFLYGYRPSSLDAALFAHIAQIREVPSTLQHIVDCYPELMRFYERILDAYFVHNRKEQECKPSRNCFVQNLHVQESNPRGCYITRKEPYEKKEEQVEETEEQIYEKQMEEESARQLKWRIALSAGVLMLGIGTYMYF